MYMDRSKTHKAVNMLVKMFATGATIGAVALAPNTVLLLEGMINKKDKLLVAYEYNRLLRHMKRLNLISIDHLADENVYVSLTPKGRARLRDVDLEEIIISIPKEWDGLWRVVSFDIPRDKSAERSEFLRHLRRLGFVLSLQSMWVYPYPCAEEVYAIAKILEIEKRVMILEAKLTRDRHKQMLKVFDSYLVKNTQSL